MQFNITQEIKSETRIGFKKITVYDLFFILCYMCMTIILANFVSSRIKIIFYIFSFVIAIILTIPSMHNPQRRFYKSLLLFLRNQKLIYQPVANTNTLIKIGNFYEREK